MTTPVCTVLTVIVPMLDTFLVLGTITVIPTTSYCGVTDMRHKQILRQLRKEALEREEQGLFSPKIERVRFVKQTRHHNRHYKGRNRHHFFRAKSRGGGSDKRNLLLIDIERHRNWHAVFGNMGAE